MKLALNTLIFSLSLLCVFNIVADAKDTHEVVLTSELVHFLDGKALGVNPQIIKRMLQIRREIKKIQFGEPNKHGGHEGHYLFEGALHSIHSMAALESTIEMAFYHKESEYLKNKSRHYQDLVALETDYNAIKSTLKTCLIQARAAVTEKVVPFAKGVREAKDQMIVLITESCQKHNRSDCFLLKWADAPKDNEAQFFNDHVTTFKALDQFCSDLTNFFDDLMRSCPKAWAQFKKMMEDQHQANARRGN